MMLTITRLVRTKIYEKAGKIEIGLKSLSELTLFFLRIAVIIAVFDALIGCISIF
jgi:hypothetical protein